MIKTRGIKFRKLGKKTKNGGLNITPWDDSKNLN
jgi:hypothetical protein